MGVPSYGHVEHDLYYVTTDANLQPRTVLGTFISPTLFTDGNRNIPSVKTLFKAENDTDSVSIHRTKGGEYMAITCRDLSSNGTYLVPSLDDFKMLMVRHRQDNVQYFVDVGKDQDIFIMGPLDDNETNGEWQLYEDKVADLPLSNGKYACMKRIAPSSGEDAVCITDFDILQSCIVVYERSMVDGKLQIRVQNRKDENHEWIVTFNTIGVAKSAGNIYYESNSVAFTIESPVHPRISYEYDLAKREIQHRSNVSKMIGRENYVQNRMMVRSVDGSLVPLTVMYRKELDDESHANESIPVLLTGYGAYGKEIDLNYNPSGQPLLDRGFVLAFAHTRGGGDLGQEWYARGRGVHKPRAVEDFLACAEALVLAFCRRGHCWCSRQSKA
jgi:oligopeptidase B